MSAPSHWDDDPTYPPADWQYEVEAGDTRLGYADWVQQQRDNADDDGPDECEGHESTDGPIGNVVFCDGTCKP